MKGKSSPPERRAAMLIGLGIALMLAVILITAAFADEPALPAGITCDYVRAKGAEIGKVRALALALANGATSAQIREAKKCLKQWTEKIPLVGRVMSAAGYWPK